MINKCFGSIIKFGAVTFPEKLYRRIGKRWRVSGIRKISLENGLKFKIYAEWDDHHADLLYYNSNSYSEIRELELFAELSGRSEVILDIGANTGIYSICASLKNNHAVIYSFEPYHINAERLRKNIKINRLQNVKVVEKALGHENSMVSIAVPKNKKVCDVSSVDKEFTNRFYVGDVEFTEQVTEQTKLDDFVESNKLTKVDLIKIDVENYELNVFNGAKKVLSEFAPVILAEIFVNNDKISFFENFLKPLGYQCYLILSDGIVHSASLTDNPDCRNYLFTRKKSRYQYLSYKNMEQLVNQLM